MASGRRALTDDERRSISYRQHYQGDYIARMRGRSVEADVFKWDSAACTYVHYMEFESINHADRWVDERLLEEAEDSSWSGH